MKTTTHIRVVEEPRNVNTKDDLKPDMIKGTIHKALSKKLTKKGT